MQTALWGMTTAVAFVPGTTMLHAEEPSFLGTWSNEIEILLESKGEIVSVPRKFSVVVEEVDASQVRGYHRWDAETDTPGYVGNQATLSASEPFIGAIDGDGVTLRLVEIKDRGMLLCELLGPDQLEVTYMETAPHPVIFTAVLQRQSE